MLQLRAPMSLPSGWVEVPTSVTSVPSEFPDSCALHAETPKLPSSALDPAVVSTLVATVPSVPCPAPLHPTVPSVPCPAPIHPTGPWLLVSALAQFPIICSPILTPSEANFS
ncbi:unnamed protein product [Staurois parvus]|uniref:Uncharacterized protein n=1 Tax=Staurois parvus TaxID=386267 RepID=A0ABN9HM32_9NEOB|nr:unnamed protein product [Staurois parvus]